MSNVLDDVLKQLRFVPYEPWLTQEESERGLYTKPNEPNLPTLLASGAVTIDSALYRTYTQGGIPALKTAIERIALQDMEDGDFRRDFMLYALQQIDWEEVKSLLHTFDDLQREQKTQNK